MSAKRIWLRVEGEDKRTETMYGAPGHAYVYMIYGMYHCLNIVTERKGFPAAVLIRGVEIEGVSHEETNGPGKVCRFLGIDRKQNGRDVTKGERLWIESGGKVSSKNIRADRRIGVDYAKHCKEYLWRFSLDHSK
jgi:DNA-3-methyladenine glycosylase